MITNATLQNNGVYVCLATNAAGIDRITTVVDVERKIKYTYIGLKF